MTRSLATYRKSNKRPGRRTRPPRDPSIDLLGFTCFRLVAIADPEPHEGPFEVIELCNTMNAMGAFLSPRQ